MTDGSYLKKLADMQTQIKELVPDSLKENEYIQGDPDHNVQVALRRLKEIYWGNIITDEYAQKFTEARKIIISALIFGSFDIVRRERMNDICTDNIFEVIEKYKQKLIEDTNIEQSPKEMEVIDNVLFRFWQMGWLKEDK